MKHTAPRINWFYFSLALFTGTVLLSFWLVSVDAFEGLYDFTRSHEEWELDELILSAFALLVVYAVTTTYAMGFLSYKIMRYAINKQAQLQQEFLVTQNLRSLGTLFAGISHSLNNLMQPIVTLSEHLISVTDKDDDRLEDLEIIHQATTQAHALSHDILRMSRQEEEDETAKQVAVDDILTDMLAILKASVPSPIIFEHDIQSHAEIKIVSRHLQTVIINIVQNAVDAIKDQGCITLSAHQETGEHPNEYTGDFKDWAVIEISDDGAGMTAETRHQLFDPFFTTKGVGEGTGLGMSITQTLVQENGGFIKIKSDLGAGTVVSLYFPVVTPELSVNDTPPTTAMGITP
jgi:signal transduction histidine kinase